MLFRNNLIVIFCHL